ncbi:hypothetical protein TNCV_4442821 [Trichonephila clavipes]|nr:hypothetical protein TNCV_4442821 [Trichonephila clavipes]
MLSLRGRTPCELPRLPKEPPTSDCRREGEEEKREENTYITAEPPKVNFWEQRAPKQPHSANSPPQPTNRNPLQLLPPHRNKAITGNHL